MDARPDRSTSGPHLLKAFREARSIGVAQKDGTRLKIASIPGARAVLRYSRTGAILTGALVRDSRVRKEGARSKNPVGSHTSIDESGNVIITTHWPDGSTDIVVRDRSGRIISRHSHNGPCVPGGACPAATAREEAEDAESDDAPSSSWEPGEWEAFEEWVEGIEAAEAAAGGP